MKGRISAGCFLFKKEQDEYKVLILHFKYKNGFEKWTAPRGGVMAGESLENGARRETTEESGYTDFDILKKLGKDSYKIMSPKRVKLKTVFWFLGKLNSEDSVEQKLTAKERRAKITRHWLDYQEAVEKLSKDEDKKFLTKAYELIKSSDPF